ncbi:hypothetical protein [Natrinema sp. H-ect4]|uniref:hypothetical protein n=1 Tax=Natrinema sp. H-ect4 TaxID=3242699 RepID=UPI0035A906EA
MTLTEKEKERSDVSQDKSRDEIPVDQWERPDDWDPISSDDLPEPDYEEYPMPDPEDLTEVPVDQS